MTHEMFSQLVQDMVRAHTPQAYTPVDVAGWEMGPTNVPLWEIPIKDGYSGYL